MVAKLLVAQFGLLVGVPAAIAVGLAYRRFRSTATDEVESFTRYLALGIKFYVGRYIRRRLAAELMLRQYARLHLRSTAVDMLVPARYPVRLKVDEVFVPLLLRDTGSQQVEYSKIVSSSSARYVIVGDPGSGKTSLMKRLFRDSCRQASTRPRGAQCPIYFELRRISELEPDDLREIDANRLFELCLEDVVDSAVFDTKVGIENLGSGPGYLLLLDGLDEVPSTASDQVVRAISDLSTMIARRSPQSTVIVSTRVQHYLALHNRQFKERFGALSVKPFSTADIYQFLINWPSWSGARRAEISRVFSRIRSLPSLQEMCTNPLALSMFVARDQETSGAQSPETRTEFYSSLVDELLVNRRARNDADSMGRQRLRTHRESVLGAVCLGHLLNDEEPGNSIPATRFQNVLQESGLTGEEAQSAVSKLSIDTGLFGPERNGETFRFLHLTLCEFLAAREVVNAGAQGWDQVRDKLTEPNGEIAQTWTARLREVISFAAGMAPRAQQQSIIDDVLEIGDSSLVLRVAIESQDYENEAISYLIRSETTELLYDSPSDWTVGWFAKLKLLLAVLRDAHAGQPTPGHTKEKLPSAAKFLTTLIDRRGAQHSLLATLAKDDPAAAVSIAESSGRVDLMNVVAGAADDFSVLTAILARCETNRHDWKVALVGRALRQRDIAEILAGTTSGTVAERDKKQSGDQWSSSALIGDSSYGRLLDDVISHPASWQDKDRQLLASIKRLRPSRSMVLEVMRSQLPAALGFLIGLAGVFVALLTSQKDSMQANLAAVLVLIGSATIGALVLSRQLNELVARRAKFFMVSGGSIVESGEVVQSDFQARVFQLLERILVQRSTRRRRETSRIAVHREILNLGRSGLRPEVSAPRAQLFSGIGKSELDALRKARSIR